MTYESDATPEEWAEATQSLKGRLVRNALGHLKELDPRPITVLQKNGLLISIELLEPSSYDIEVLGDRSHPARIKVPPGPMLVSYKEADRSEASLWHVEDLLHSLDPNVRSAALAHFTHMAVADTPLLTSRTRAILDGYASDLQSEDSARWRQAAIAIADALRDDFFCNLAGVRQAVRLSNDDALYTPRILYPAALSLDKADVPVWKPSNQRAEIEERIRRHVEESSSLREACSQYYRELGYIPLAESLSMVRLVDEWLGVHGSHDQAWPEIWTWADGILSPLPRYHACMVFMRRPDLIPDGKLDDLWKEIADVVCLPSVEGTNRSRSPAWQIRCELARHYAWHLESHFPGQDSEQIAGLSWWLAEQVSSLFGTNPQLIEHVICRVVRPAAESSSFVWQLARTPIAPSRLRYNTLFAGSVWSLSLLSGMDELLRDCLPVTDIQPQKSEIDKAMTQAAIQAFPMKPFQDDEQNYAFEQGLLASAERWLQATGDSRQPTLLHALVSAAPKVAAAEWLPKALEDLPKADPGNQTLITSVLRMMAFTGIIPADTIWDSLSKAEWAKEVVRKLDLNAVESLFQALVEVQVQNGERWLAQVPHLFAYGCEEAAQDRDRQKFFFGLTVVSSASGGGTSAIRRLLRGKHKRKLAKEKDFWRKQLEALRPQMPAWVAARARALMASLHTG